jgi:membrane-anchored protein YejM (alkaline phosphatase superfamily)
MNVILVSIDALRFDCVGYQKNKCELLKYDVLKFLNTPNLDEIAKKSACFTNAISVSTYTTSAHASILTGLYPPRHGVRAFYDTKLYKNVLSLAEIFRKEGYVTVLSTDSIELFDPLDLTRGFSHIFAKQYKKQDRDLYDFLDLNRDKKIFLFIHFLDVHEPYMFSEYEICSEYNSDYYDMINFLCDKYDIELNNPNDIPHALWNFVRSRIGNNIDIFLPFYIKGVTKFDKGRFKEFLYYIKDRGYIDNSILTIFSDHGEGRSDEENHDIFTHAGFPYENVIRVPLIMCCNGIKANTIDEQVSIVDIFPTVLKMALNKKLEDIVPYNIDGENLFGYRHRNYVLGEVWGCNFNLFDDEGIVVPDKNVEWSLNYRFIRSENKKYIIYGRPDAFLNMYMFDLSNDEFVKQLYRCILGRIEDKQGLEHWSKDLNSNAISKKNIINYFLQSEEYQNKRKFSVFELDVDPEELKPIDPLKSFPHTIEFITFINNILASEKNAIISEKVFDGMKKQTSDNLGIKEEEDEKEIKERLKNLGYFS